MNKVFRSAEGDARGGGAAALPPIATSEPARLMRRHMERARRFVGKRFSPGERLGLHLSLGVVSVVAAIAVFAAVAAAVSEQARLVRFDGRVAERLHEHAQTHPMSVACLMLVTELGSFQFLAALTLGIAVLFQLRGRGRLATAWLLVVSGGLLHAALKWEFQRLRPEFADPFVFEASWSFPSGHSMGSLIGYGLLAYLLARAIRPFWARASVVLGSTALVLAIGFSRIYLGAHYFSDVIGGFAAGSGWLAIAITLFEVARRSPAPGPPSEPHLRPDRAGRRLDAEAAC